MPKSPFEFTGGNVCLDFVNTVNNRGNQHPEELISDYTRLVQWSKEASLTAPRVAERLLHSAAESPGTTQLVVRQAIELRESIHDIFLAVAERRGVPATALATLNQHLRRASEHLEVAYANRRFSWQWMFPEQHLDSMLWPVVRSAADLLVSEDLALVRQCASDTCAWLFVDHTKNHRRRWCEMKTCGNRHKARRYYQRQKMG